MDLSNLGRTMPPAWRALLDRYQGAQQPMAVRAEIDVFMLLADLCVRARLQDEAEAAAERRAEESKTVAKQLSFSTIVLAAATVVLAIATIVLIFITAAD